MVVSSANIYTDPDTTDVLFITVPCCNNGEKVGRKYVKFCEGVL